MEASSLAGPPPVARAADPAGATAAVDIDALYAEHAGFLGRASVVLGRIEYLPAKSGTLIVDQNSNCFAGRFRVDFGDNGELGGWFSTPWLQ